MSNVVPQRSAKPSPIRPLRTSKARVLKFDRHAGVIVVEKHATIAKPGGLIRLVRNLLNFLKPNRPPAPMKSVARQR